MLFQEKYQRNFFRYHLETTTNLWFFCFQGVHKGKINSKWFNPFVPYLSITICAFCYTPKSIMALQNGSKYILDPRLLAVRNFMRSGDEWVNGKVMLF